MKIALCLLACVCLAQAFHLPAHTADKTFLIKQKNIYELFWHVDQPTVYHPELYEKARSFSLADNLDKFKDQKVVLEFLELLKHGMLPRGHVFSMMNHEVHHQAVVLFRVLYNAKDFETFYNTAVWARFHVNEQMFIYVLSVAVIHHPETKYMKNPPLYEVLPHFFFNDETLHQAYEIAMGDVGAKKTVGGVNLHVVPANYSGWYATRHNVPEQKMTYFTEDVGLNAFYFLVNHDYPAFMGSDEYKFDPNVRGQLYFYAHKQLLVRYYLERLVNDMPEIDYVNVDDHIATGYYPSMHFHNGLPFPQRAVGEKVPLHMNHYVQQLKDIHTRISNAIDVGYVIDKNGDHVQIYTPEGLNVLGNIIQGNADSVNQVFYGQFDTLCRKVLGFGLEGNMKYQMVPSALEVYSTSSRDPIFYSMYKMILQYFHQYASHLPKYTKEQLAFPGVKIETVTVDKLQTYFETYESMINNAVSVRSHEEAQANLIKARQYRLNHKPYSYHITVQSDKNVKAFVRVFLGPKFDEHGHEITFEKNYMNFLELDEWQVDLKVGQNKIERSSHESMFVVPDEVPSDVFYKKLLKSIDGGESFTYTSQPYGFPDRLMLPKGKKEGMPFKLFVVVSHFDETKMIKMDSPIWGQSVVDGHPMGFPLDRPVVPHHFEVSNIFVKDVVIYHKQMEELNITV